MAHDHSASIRKGMMDSVVTVNGMDVGSDPALVFHGDRLQIDGSTFVFVDEAHAGLTAQMPIVSRADEVLQMSSGGGGPKAAGALSNGRLLSLADGREYAVLGEGLTIGRDAACDIVIASGEVSRRHARVEPRPDGYVLVDTSTNGVVLNGKRIKGTHLLNRGDTIRIGPEELKFNADVRVSVISPVPPVLGSRAVAVEGPMVAAPPPKPPSSGDVRLSNSPAPDKAIKPAPAQPPAAESSRPVLATLEITNEGPTKGMRFNVVTALTHVGRGAHNDVVLNDESVSDSHAKVQRRADGWVVVDMDSTNGTYVGGTRVEGEMPLTANADLRFGGVKLFFKTAGSPSELSSGTRVIVGYRPPTPMSSDVAGLDESNKSGSSESRGVSRGVILGLIAIAVAVIVLMMMSG
jgi:pSer/pThr/pTyr-binding forkhead associated (FHA) protein